MKMSVFKFIKNRFFLSIVFICVLCSQIVFATFDVSDKNGFLLYECTEDKVSFYERDAGKMINGVRLVSNIKSNSNGSHRVSVLNNDGINTLNLDLFLSASDSSSLSDDVISEEKLLVKPLNVDIFLTSNIKVTSWDNKVIFVEGILNFGSKHRNFKYHNGTAHLTIDDGVDLYSGEKLNFAQLIAILIHQIAF